MPFHFFHPKEFSDEYHNPFLRNRQLFFLSMRDGWPQGLPEIPPIETRGCPRLLHPSEVMTLARRKFGLQSAKEHGSAGGVLKQNGVMPRSTTLFCWLRLVQTNFIPEITSLLLLLIGRLEFPPCGGKFSSGSDMPFEADAVGERLTVPVKGDVFNLVVVYDVGLSSRIGVCIELLL